MCMEVDMHKTQILHDDDQKYGRKHLSSRYGTIFLPTGSRNEKNKNSNLLPKYTLFKI